jgi:hypothetical protein
MKTKILLTATATMVLAYTSLAADAGKGHGERGNGYGNQQIVVNNYYSESGYEYASRLKRFHNSYVVFDFYSPLYTETFWYHYTPYTWGVSIYDDWYYYGGGVSRYNWTSGFGGSYWWGYDPWLDYDPWMGYGWNSWYAPGVSYGINYYLGRPYYHYPMAWNSWDNPNWNAYNPYYGFDHHNNPYGPGYRDDYYHNNNNNNNPGYNPSSPYDPRHRSGYSVSTRRSSGAQPANPRDNTGSSQAGDGRKSGSGTYTEHGRRGVPVTDGANRRETEIPDNTKANETTVPRRGTTGTTPPTTTGTDPRTTSGTAPRTTTGTTTPENETTTRRSPMEVEKPASVVRITEPEQPRQQTQTVVRTNRQVKETTMRQSSTGSSSTPEQSTVRKSSQSGTPEAAESTSSSGNESGKTGSSSKRRR